MTTPAQSNGEMLIKALLRYPVKSFSGQNLETVEAKPNQCFPYDRAYAIANGPTQFNPASPTHLPKINFLNLMRHERLALLNIEFDEETETLTILREGRQVAKGNLKESIGRNMIEQFIAGFMHQELKGPPRLQSAPNHHFADCAAPMVHIINLQSVTALEHLMNEQIDPLRFRANIWLEGTEPWYEKQWIGKTLKIGEVEIEIVDMTSRCAAINVDLKTAKRGRSVSATLLQHFQSENFGVYGVITKGGTLKVNDTASIL